MLKTIFLKIKKHPIFYVLIILSLFSSVLGIVLPYINGKFVDVLISINNNDASFIYSWAILLLVIGMLNIIFSYLYSITSKKFINRLSYELNKKAINHIWNLEYQEIGKINLSYLMQRIYTDSDTVISFFIGNFMALIINAATIVALIFILLNVNVYYLLISVVFSIIYAGVFWIFRKHLSIKTYECRNASNSYYSVLNTQLSNYEDIKIQSSYNHGNKLIDNSFSIFWNTLKSFLKTSQRVSSIEGVISLLFQITSFLIGGYQVINKIMSIGEFTIVNSYFTILLSCITYYFNYGKSYQETLVSYERLKEIFSWKRTDNVPQFNTENINDSLIYQIKLCNISFKYDTMMIINRLNVECNTGDLLVITGKNGAGKSTLLKLIIGLIKPNAGQIFYNDKNSIYFDWIEVRKNQIAYSSQHLPCEQMEVLELISDLDIDNLKTYSVLIFKDPEFIDNILNKKMMDLSLGEKNKLLIIRALSKNASVILLDEPTANLDAQSVNNLLQYLLTLKNKIIICTTHDNKLINNATKIINL